MPQDNGPLGRGLQILTLLQSVGRLKVSEIAKRLDIPLSTTYRYVTALKSAGFAFEFEGEILRGARLADPSDGSNHLVRFAAPVLHRLRAETGLTAVLAVRIHLVAVALESALAHPKHTISYQRGVVRPLHAGASALALLAFAPAEVLEDVLDSPMRRYTASTPSRGELTRELEQIRSSGYVFSVGQLIPGMAGIAVPVIVEGHCLCSLSLVGDPLSTSNVDELVSRLRRAGAELAASLPSERVREVWRAEDE